MEKENQKLREENQRIKDEIRNKLVLEEEVHDLKNRLMKFKDQEAKFSSVQVRVKLKSGRIRIQSVEIFRILDASGPS